MQRVNFETGDGIVLAADYYQGGRKAVLLLHMMPATKESWRSFAEDLTELGYTALAFDQRGHGGSTDDGRLNYQQFSREQHQDKRFDLEAAHDWLRHQGKQLTALAGASIGANLGLRYQADNQIAKSILLSPGLDYYGVTTPDAAEALSDPQGIFIRGAEGDLRAGGMSCAEAARQLYGLAPLRDKQVRTMNGNEHGTDLLAADTSLSPALLDWLGSGV